MAAATSEPTRAIYYDPWAAGDEGPHIRYPNDADADKSLPGFLQTSRNRLTLRQGSVEVEVGSTEEQVMRGYLAHRGFNPDAYKGDDLGLKKMRCQCGFETGNAEAATSHKARWTDHDIQLVH